MTGELDPVALPRGLVLLGRYRLAGALGRGGMGAVYEVEDLRTERRLALKVMGSDVGRDPDLLRRFELEARAPSRAPAHVVPVLDAGLDPDTGLACLAMEKLEGDELGRWLGAHGRLAPEEALGWLEGVARALDALHAGGVVHRDVKPENVFRTEDGVVRLLDLGIARLVSPSRSLHSTRSLGSPLYMAPEQLEGDPLLDGRADVYAFGHLAFTCLTGEAYWQRAWAASKGVYPLLLRVMRGGGRAATEAARERGVTLPAGFDRWFAAATARSPEARYDTAGEALLALRAVLAGRAAPLPRRRAPTPWRVGVGGALLAVAALGGRLAWPAGPSAETLAAQAILAPPAPPEPRRAPPPREDVTRALTGSVAPSGRAPPDARPTPRAHTALPRTAAAQFVPADPKGSAGRSGELGSFTAAPPQPSSPAAPRPSAAPVRPASDDPTDTR